MTSEEIEYRLKRGMPAAFFVIQWLVFWRTLWRTMTFRVQWDNFKLVYWGDSVMELRAMRDGFLKEGPQHMPAKDVQRGVKIIEDRIEAIRSVAWRRYSELICACDCVTCRSLQPSGKLSASLES